VERKSPLLASGDTKKLRVTINAEPVWGNHPNICWSNRGVDNQDLKLSSSTNSNDYFGRIHADLAEARGRSRDKCSEAPEANGHKHSEFPGETFHGFSSKTPVGYHKAMPGDP
jgi:hypothetical protein